MSEEKRLVPIEAKEQIESAVDFIESIADVKFTNDEEYQNGVELIKAIKKHIKELEGKRKELVKPLNDDVKTINSEFDVVKMLQGKERIIKNSMSKYFQIKEQKRIEEQRKQEAEAEEKRRKEEERARKEREKEESYRREGKEELADKAAARAETHESVASSTVAPIVNDTTKTKGVSYTTSYMAEIINKKQAIEECLKKDILLLHVSINLKGIEAVAKTMKGLLKIGGIRITEYKRPSVKTH